MVERIPFVPLPIKKALKASRRFLSLGSAIARAKPSLKLNLYQAEIDIDSREYVAMAIFSGIFFGFLMFGIAIFIGVIANALDIFVSMIVALGFGGFVFIYVLNWPKLFSSKRIRELDKDVLGALQHMTIEIKSGVTLFNALVGVSSGYGKVSEEFKKVVKEINAGIPETEALDKSSQRNPSLYFRRAIWQLVNALKAGSDVAKALEAIVDNLVKEQQISIRKYGQELNPYTMMYMLFAVILPSLGITFLIIISSFSGITVPKIIFPLILVILIMFQYFYMGLVKTKRPNVEV